MVPTKFGSVALTAQLLVNSGSCSIIKTWGWLDSVSGPNNYGFFQLHDQIAALTGGEVPEIVVPLEVLATASFDFSGRPWTFNNGLIVAVSATGPTFTLGSLGWFTGEILV